MILGPRAFGGRRRGGLGFGPRRSRGRRGLTRLESAVALALLLLTGAVLGWLFSESIVETVVFFVNQLLPRNG